MIKLPVEKKQVCIIKLDGIGDVLRTTPILSCFRGEFITWVTEEQSFPVLENNNLIGRVVSIADTQSIAGMVFDELYNFDEDMRACALAHNLKAKKKKGFSVKDGHHFPFDADSEYAYVLSKNDELKFRLNKKTYQQIIFEMAGCRWEGQDYILGYQPKGAVKYGVGINYLVGKKFPNKAWPHWKELSGMLDSACLQNQFKTLKEYIDWVNSCRILVTGDSLGMHIALALKKKVIILMGSTSWHEIETYGRGVVLRAELSCSPCYKKDKCSRASFCMDLITPEMVYSEIKKICQSGY